MEQTEAITSNRDSVARRRKRSHVRWIIVSLVFAGLLINYVDRANLAIALPFIEEDLGISPALGGLLLGGFYWTYSLLQIPAGKAVDQFGPKVMFAGAVAWWSLCTAATSVTRGFGSLFGLRLLLGVGEAAAFPSAVKTVSRWFPPKERGTATGIYLTGARSGTLLSVPIVTALIAWIGWRGSFIVTGALGLVWVVVWWFYYRNPELHKSVSAAELELIKEGKETKSQDDQGQAIRWTDVFRQRNVWAASLGYFCMTFVMYFFITWFPSYLIQAQGFSLLQLGIFGSIPALAGMLGQWGGGVFTDYLTRRGTSVTKARKGCIIGGSLVSTVIALSAFTDSAFVALTLMSISAAALMFADSSIWTLPLDLAPTGQKSWEGSITGVVNGISNLAGIASPAVIGFAVALTGSFESGLVIIGAFSIAAVLIFGLGMRKIEPMTPSGAQPHSAGE